MNNLYPYFEMKGVDWQAVHSRYLPRVQAAADHTAYFSAIGDMLAELHDGHTVLRVPYPNNWRFGSAEDVDGYAVVSEVGPTARKAGLQRGDVLLALDGKAVDEYLQSLDPRFRSGSTPWNTRYISYPHLLDVPAAGKLEVTFAGVDGKTKTVTLQAPDLKTAPASGTGDYGAPPSAVQSERLPSGIGVIRIARFWNDPDEAVSTQFDTALNSMMDAPGIILDLRGNGGGNSLIADAIAGVFWKRPFIMGMNPSAGRSSCMPGARAIHTGRHPVRLFMVENWRC
jgi:carboxyl-terminal processing protease